MSDRVGISFERWFTLAVFGFVIGAEVECILSRWDALNPAAEVPCAIQHCDNNDCRCLKFVDE